jgi:hypothetical protein
VKRKVERERRRRVFEIFGSRVETGGGEETWHALCRPSQRRSLANVSLARGDRDTRGPAETVEMGV